MDAVGEVGDFIETYEYNAGTGVGGGKYEIVAADPGFNLINPAKTDGSGYFLQLITASIDIAQAGVVFDDATDNSTAINQCFSAFRRVTNEQANGSVARAQGLLIDTAFSVFVNSGTLKLIDAATTKYLLRVNADDCFVFGGYYDGNRLAGGQTTSLSWFDLQLIAVLDCSNSHVSGITGFNGAGPGITVRGCTRIDVNNNTLYDIDQNGIYHDALSDSCMYNDNHIDVSVASIESPSQHHGILCTHASPADNINNIVSGNTVYAQTTGATLGNICIAVRGYECTITDNVTVGGNMGLSIDRATDCIVNDNLIRDVDTASTSSYGIELNGPRNSVVGNVIKGSKYGIVASSSNDHIIDNVIQGNSISDVERGIFVSNHPLVDCYGWSISGNTITASEFPVYLTDFERFSIVGNRLETTDGTKKTMLFNTPSNTDVNLTISNNILVGGNRLYGLTDGSANTYNNIFMSNNIYSGITSEVPLAEGSAIFGTGITFDRMVSGVRYEYTDYANTVVNIWARPTTPEGFVNVNKGSMCTSLDGNVYRKSTDGVSTGWVAM
jgi:hypothetical protein